MIEELVCDGAIFNDLERPRSPRFKVMPIFDVFVVFVVSFHMSIFTALWPCRPRKNFPTTWFKGYSIELP